MKIQCSKSKLLAEKIKIIYNYFTSINKKYHLIKLRISKS